MPVQYTLQQPNAPEPSPVEKPQPEKERIPKGAFAIGGIVAFLIIFFFGFILGRVTKPGPAAPAPTPTPTLAQSQQVSPTPTSYSEQPAATIDFLPGKQYFDDTFAVIEKAAPHRTLLVSISRIEQKQNYIEYIKANYYTGQGWERTSLTTTQPNGDIAANTLLKEWHDPATILSSNENISTVQVENDQIAFSSDKLQDVELSIQSQPGATKFAYQGTGTMTINGDKNDAYVYRSRTYSFNASYLSFLTQPEVVSSDWMVFWDSEGNFYNFEKRDVQDSTSPIQKLEIGIREDVNHNILKSNQTSVSLGKDQNVQVYQVTLNDPVDDRVNILVGNPLNKADKKSYLWVVNSGEGSVVQREGRKVSGIGIFEFIKPQNS